MWSTSPRIVFTMNHDKRKWNRSQRRPLNDDNRVSRDTSAEKKLSVSVCHWNQPNAISMRAIANGGGSSCDRISRCSLNTSDISGGGRHNSSSWLAPCNVCDDNAEVNSANMWKHTLNKCTQQNKTKNKTKNTVHRADCGKCAGLVLCCVFLLRHVSITRSTSCFVSRKPLSERQCMRKMPWILYFNFFIILLLLLNFLLFL